MKNNKPNSGIFTEEIIGKLQEILKPSGWYNLLKGFLVSEDFYKIIQTLEQQVLEKKRFTPPLKQVFKAFQECPLDKLKVVIVNDEPYHQMGVADGIAFSCGNTLKRETALKYIHKAVVETVYKGKKDIKDLNCDLSSWSNQGVLLLNLALTTEMNKPKRHFVLWRAFSQYLFDMLNAKKEPIIWVFLGENAESYSELIEDHHVKLFASHPMSASEMKQSNWNCDNLFCNINKHLQDLQLLEIEW